MKTPTRNARELLVRCLVLYEVAWAPFRNGDWASRMGIQRARDEGLRYWASAGDGRRRKQSQRERDELTEAGLLLDGKITRKGLRAARGWTYRVPRNELITALERLLDALDRGDYCEFYDAQWVPEAAIAGSWTGWQLGVLQEALLPLLADGVLKSNSLYIGNAFYSLPEKSADTLFDSVADLLDGDFDESLSEEYTEHYTRCRQALREDPVYYNQIGILHLPPLPLKSTGYDYNPVVDRLTPLFREQDTE